MTQIFDFQTGLNIESASIVKEIADAEDFSTVIINASVDGILTYDSEWRYTLWSPAMEQISGLKSADVVGRKIFDVFPFLEEAGMADPIRRSLAGESVRSPSIPFYVPETGKRGYTEQQNFPLYDEAGEITGGMAVVRDVTLTKQNLDALAAKNRVLEARIQELSQTLDQAGP
jgi:PAS domain S-box-containing protein